MTQTAYPPPEMEKNKLITLGALIGAAAMSFGIGLAINTQVAVAPPEEALPLTVVNMSWSLVFFFMLKHDIRFGYIGAILVGISMVLFPALVFTDVLGPAPTVVPGHFVGVPTDIVLGVILVVTGVRGLSSQHG